MVFEHYYWNTPILIHHEALPLDLKGAIVDCGVV
jgi:hypothetical protein